MNTVTNFEPNWASPPGATIADILSEQGLSVPKFAKEMNATTDYVNELLGGYIGITEDIADKLESILGASAEFWLRRENQYQEDFKRVKILEEEKWVKELPVADMVKFGWIKQTKNKVAECLRFFNVDSVQEWRREYEEKIEAIAFRTSTTFKAENAAVTAWLRQGEISGEKIECGPWSETLFEEKLKVARMLTRKKNPKEFLPELINMCAECGVAVAIVRSPAGCRASGATKFINQHRALLLLSFRYLSDDQFWFTFFHEAGHILLHGSKSFFLEEVGGEKERNHEEREANIFAGEMLIPRDLQSKLPEIRGNKRNIINFAAEAGVSPGIVVGQLQYRGFISPKYLNAYKRRYNWDDIAP
ncbi:MAG: hypothetical protein JWO06_979 [Bacteroidota bacterium]|nr:hypothetical protein [Bacteroidota bacterium]